MKGRRVLLVPVVALSMERLLVALAWQQDVIRSLLGGSGAAALVVLGIYLARLVVMIGLVWSVFVLARNARFPPPSKEG